MKTVRHNSPGYFPTPKGTCFVKPDLPLGDGTKMPGPNWHPFIVITDGDDYVECLMGRTLYNDNKNRTNKLETIEGAVEILDPCPPMDYANRRRQYVDASQVMVIPKAVLYEASDVEICSFQGLKLSDEQTETLAKAAKKNSTNRFASYTDPYDFENKTYDIEKYKDQAQNFKWGTNYAGYPIYIPPTQNKTRATPEIPIDNTKSQKNMEFFQ